MSEHNTIQPYLNLKGNYVFQTCSSAQKMKYTGILGYHTAHPKNLTSTLIFTLTYGGMSNRVQIVGMSAFPYTNS